ncbi:sodium:proton antiporter [Corynebacterium guaraldiae]|uniref:Cation:proton antiporter subunit C n=2 Tax=Corynebacterium TaxID=1716 RepID=A0ABU9UF32_9CORY|nr:MULTISPECIES: cation:proton antiporter subunit C [Corynebacterium]MBE7338721.1 cation:proton antiporter subunit C [Corynebacterium aurimucosum]MBE7364034.1 cation:proton antiporter subunit C [Corynebacterium aurimucosum]MCG7260818.1 cation:proton antiporter subunit C [Corynebacterium aurimucosum]MCZ9297346.1 cation:proton antiporter subunit C [Corynebacterium hesseae]MDK6806133.1 cation:proton antiporter subunit C [Corynebacterium aurimucosum]
MILALTIALLIGSAVYLIQQRGLVHIVLGMMAFGHGANLMLLATGVYSYRGESFPSQVPADQMADPLPQAFVLTAVVISMATSTILLTMAAMGANDDTDVVEPVDDNTIDHAFSTLGRDTQNREILQRSANKMDRLKELDHEGEK